MDKDLEEAIMNASIMQTEDIFNARVQHVVECLVLGDENIRRELRIIAGMQVDSFKRNLMSNIEMWGTSKPLNQIIKDTYI